MLFLTSGDVRELATITDVVGFVEDGYDRLGRGEITDVPRKNVRSEAIEGNLKSMPAAGTVGLGGILYTGGWSDRSSELATKVTVIFDDATGELSCLIESDRLSWLRTGATSAVATKYCALEDASTLGLIGSGKQARSQLLAVDAVREFDTAHVYSPTPSHREAFAREMTGKVRPTVRAVDSAKDAVVGRDVICTATKSKTPVFDGDWLEPGTHVNAIGAHYPDEREVDATTVRKSEVIADSLQRAQSEEGELIIPEANGQFSWDEAVELGSVVCGDTPGRRHGDQITLLTSGGLSMEYLVTARGLYELADRRDVGTELP